MPAGGSSRVNSFGKCTSKGTHMIDWWMQREPNFAHHLSNEVKVEQAFRPGLVRQRGKVQRVTLRTAVDYHRVRPDCCQVSSKVGPHAVGNDLAPVAVTTMTRSC
jgi:hypothetical protein